MANGKNSNAHGGIVHSHTRVFFVCFYKISDIRRIIETNILKCARDVLLDFHSICSVVSFTNNRNTGVTIII